MTATRTRQPSVEELQRAYMAAVAGEFAVPARRIPLTSRFGRPVGGFTAAGERLTGLPGGADAPVSRGAATLTGPVVLVLAAHSGAGASTVALALSEAWALNGTPTRLIECADPARSGVAAATDAELGEDGFGWRRGRRQGGVEVDRPAGLVRAVEEVPAARPVEVTAGGGARTVVDAGWPVRDVLHGDGWVSELLHAARVVLVCRVTVPAVRQAEQVLAALPATTTVAAVGPARWPGAVVGTCGPLLRAAREAGRVVPVPHDRGLELTGPAAGPLPKQLASAGRALTGLFIDAIPGAGPGRLTGGKH